MCGICGCGTSSPVAPDELSGLKFAAKPNENPGRGALTASLIGHKATQGANVSEQRLIEIEQSLQSKNNHYAGRNREFFKAQKLLVLNVLSSPGSGKTSLLVRSLNDVASDLAVAVIEGDQQSSLDADRIRATGVKAFQINTGKGCHLEAEQVGAACQALSVEPSTIVFVENVGNLVCPAAFDLGEQKRVVVLSVTEGEDKPLKYPDMFVSADLVLINKVDLLPYVDFDVNLCQQYIARLNPDAQILLVSAKTGDGMADWYQFIDNARAEFLAQGD